MDQAEKKAKRRGGSPTSRRGGHIENIGPKLQRITWNQGKRGKNIRLKVHGNQETALKILQKLRDEFYGNTHGITVKRDTTTQELLALVVQDYESNDLEF